MKAFVDTNILVRHLTYDPPAIARGATAFLASQPELYLADLIAAETVYVLDSFYKAPRRRGLDSSRGRMAGSHLGLAGHLLAALPDEERVTRN